MRRIAKQAAHLFVFQRTPNFSMPAWNGPLDPAFQRQRKATYREHRRQARESAIGVPVEDTALSTMSALAVSPEERQHEMESRWTYGGFRLVGSFNDVLINKQANETVAEFVRQKIRAIVHDADVAEPLCPKDHPICTKRPCVDIAYFQTYNRDNVTLVNVRHAPIADITPTGLRTQDAAYDLDSIVFATGFDAMTGALLNMDIRGRAGKTLKETWADGPRTYLGLMTAGFPNMFTMTGPGSPSVLSTMVVSIEQHVDWIADCLQYLREHDLGCIEPTVAAQDLWVGHVNEVGNDTPYPEANSWYVRANIPGKPRVFMPYVGGVGNYRKTCDEVAANGYERFTQSP